MIGTSSRGVGYDVIHLQLAIASAQILKGQTLPVDRAGRWPGRYLPVNKNPHIIIQGTIEHPAWTWP